ncbi:MAG: hypothetical protein LBM68_05950 [Bacteroidales bacterium]|jgi:hypothetical protein|nr:hypothetical protein [Bacteroidales bacterium]
MHRKLRTLVSVITEAFANDLRKNNDLSHRLSFVIGVGLLAIPVFALCIATIFFICGSSINPVIFPLSVLLSLLLMFFLNGNNLKQFIGASLMVLAIVSTALVIASLTYDFAYDGQWYHQDIIFRLTNGWNPIYTWHSHEPIVHSDIWVNHYAKGLETIAATMYSLTGNIESGKAVNFIIVTASGFLCFSFLRKIFTFLSQWKSIFFACMFVLCPVVISQLFTLNIDWASYLLIFLTIFALISYEKQPTVFLQIFIAVLIMLMISVKFNLFFWGGFVFICFFVYWFFTKKANIIYSLLKPCVIAVCVSVFAVSFNPYITNSIDHKQPLYPLMGKDKYDIIPIITPSFFQNKSAVYSVFTSVFAQPKVQVTTTDNFPFLDITIRAPRIYGWGFYFSWIVLLSLLLYISIIVYKRDWFRNKDRLPYSIFLTILFGGMFVLPAGWFARYYPFMYAFPLVICLYLEKERHTLRLLLRLRYVVYGLLLMNTIIVSLHVKQRIGEQHAKINNLLTVLSETKEIPRLHVSYNAGVKIKLDAANIPYYVPPTPELRKALILTFPIHPEVFLDTAQFYLKDKVLYKK